MTNYSARQRSGSEFGGVNRTSATIQPKPSEALSPSDQLRLGYLTGDESNSESIEDRRQAMGLRPANGRRPMWLSEVSPTRRPRLDSEVHRQGWDDESGPLITSDPDMPLDNG